MVSLYISHHTTNNSFVGNINFYIVTVARKIRPRFSGEISRKYCDTNNLALINITQYSSDRGDNNSESFVLYLLDLINRMEFSLDQSSLDVVMMSLIRQLGISPPKLKPTKITLRKIKIE